MVLETHMGLYMTDPDFLEKKLFLSKKLGKEAKNGSRIGFFEFIEEFRN